MVAGRTPKGYEFGLPVPLTPQEWSQKRSRTHKKRLLTQRRCMAELRQRRREEEGLEKRVPFSMWSEAKKKMALENRREKTKLRMRRHRAIKKRFEKHRK